MALVAAVTVVVAPGPLPAWLAPADALSVGAVLPAAFAVVAGAAIAHQVAAHGRAGAGWWTGRITRRVVVLLATGLALQVLLLLPEPSRFLAEVRFTGDLARLGVATGLGLLLVRLPAQVRGALAAALVTVHAALVLGGTAGVTAAGALTGLDQRLLGTRALAPVDPDGIAALAPTLGLVLVGIAVGDWLRGRPRGSRTAGLLGAGALAAALAAWVAADLVPVVPAVWTPPVLAGGLAVVLALLCLGHLGTRRAWSDRWVATVAVAGRVTLPLWVLAVVVHRWFGGTPPVRWVVREVLWPPFGRGATVVFGLLVGAGLVRLGGAMVDRGWTWRA